VADEESCFQGAVTGPESKRMRFLASARVHGKRLFVIDERKIDQLRGSLSGCAGSGAPLRCARWTGVRRWGFRSG